MILLTMPFFALLKYAASSLPETSMVLIFPPEMVTFAVTVPL